MNWSIMMASTGRSMVLGHSAGGHLALWLATATDARPWLTVRSLR